MINLPFGVKLIAFILVAVHIVRVFGLPQDVDMALVHHLAFIPGYWTALLTGNASLDLWVILSPLTHLALHGSWFHLLLNVFMLAAFGSAVERGFGRQTFLLIFMAGAALGACAQYILDVSSMAPVIGASGGISALFAMGLICLFRQGRLGPSLKPILVVWILITIGFGLLGGPEGETIAWAAHLGGFMAGLGYAKLKKLI